MNIFLNKMQWQKIRFVNNLFITNYLNDTLSCPFYARKKYALLHCNLTKLIKILWESLRDIVITIASSNYCIIRPMNKFSSNDTCSDETIAGHMTGLMVPYINTTLAMSPSMVAHCNF